MRGILGLKPGHENNISPIPKLASWGSGSQTHCTQVDKTEPISTH